LRIVQDFAGLLYHIGIMAEQVGWIFGSGVSRSRTEGTEVEVRACRGGDVARFVDGGRGWGAAGSASFDDGDDAEHGATWGDSGTDAANDGG
jgi:hypothetical protein